MNSYPPELLLQLAPVMFVAGLEGPRPLASSPPTATDSGNLSPTPTTPKRVHSDPFTSLTNRLRDALNAQRKPAIWAPEAVRKSKTFQTVLVDKTVQFPPRKIPPSQDPSASQMLRSPLSPLTPSSPLYPDGLIAPIWVRKHTSLVPSVFVLFLRLYEHPASTVTPRSPLEPDSPELQRDREERDKEERRNDTELAREIADRKKNTNERGMKLTVVLIASRRMLDDPALDTRLTFIRRTSGLDSRAALFVLSPVAQAELLEFIKSLMQALYDPAVEYYASHSKRVRRKRNRHAQSTHYPVALANTSARPTPLRPEGWTVRYEYKMACFAEFRGEEEVALKHYQDAYSTLMIMFGSPAMLQPRTKRWAEAKVLADCINVKICKLYLYNSEHALALSQLNQHLRRFSDLSSRVWGIGEETFEYWSWLARQYRVFAELIEQGTAMSLTIPTHLPVPTPASTQPLQEIDALRALGMNPSTALMHPGFYYYVAAECTERRRERFLAALEKETNASQAPGFANEKKVDHLASILESYTKSYELFKKYASTTAPSSPPSQQQQQGRFTLWIAYRIGQTYYSYGKYDMAIKFFERIAKTYRREHWGTMLRPLLRKWYACAQQLGDVDLSIKLLAEMLTTEQDTSDEEEEDVAEDLLAVLKSTVPSSDEPLVVDLTEAEPLLDSSVIFWSSEAHVDEHITFQVTLSAVDDLPLSSLPFSELRIYHTGSETPLVINHAPSKDTSASVELINVGNISVSSTEPGIVSGNLRWGEGHSFVLTGSITSNTSQTLQFERATIILREGSWVVELPFRLNVSRRQAVNCPRWLTSIDRYKYIPIRRDNAHIATFKHRPHQVHVSFSHHSPAYLDEQFPIIINVTNYDDRELAISLDVLLQPGDDGSVNHLALDDQQSSSLIKGVSFGRVHPGVTACRTLQLSSTGVAGERMLDISIQSRTVLPGESASPTSPVSAGSTTTETGEILQTLVIPTISPFAVTHDVSYRRKGGKLPHVSDLRAFEQDFWDDSVGGRADVITVVECSEYQGTSDLTIENIELIIEDTEYSKLHSSSVEDEEFPFEFMPGDQLSLITEFDLAPPEDFFADGDAKVPKPGHYIVTWKRAHQGSENVAKTRIDLLPFQPPSDGLVALLHVPPLGYLHQPLTLELVIRNSHPARSACPAVSIEFEQSESFVVAGVRSARLPLLVPGAEERVTWNIIPLECGPSVPLPRIRVFDKRRDDEKREGTTMEDDGAVDEVPVIDVRGDRRRTGTEPVNNQENSKAPASNRRFTMIISPS